MEEDIEIKRLEISEEQAKSFAYDIFKDIGEYVQQHLSEFVWWLFQEKLNEHKHITVSVDEGVIVTTADGKILKYKYT